MSRRLSDLSTAKKIAFLERPGCCQYYTAGRERWHVVTALIDVVFRLCDIRVHHTPDTRFLADMAIALAQDDQLFARNVVLFDRFANDLLRHAIGVDIGCVPSVQAAVICRFEDRQRLIVPVSESPQGLFWLWQTYLLLFQHPW